MAVTKVVMPKLSEQMESGKIIKWLKQEGDRVNAGDAIAEVETDKADVEMEAFGSGVLRKILVPPGDTTPVGTLIGVIAEPGDDISGLAGGAAAPAPAATPAGQPAATGAAGMASRPAAVPPTPKGEDHAERPQPRAPASPGVVQQVAAGIEAGASPAARYPTRAGDAPAPVPAPSEGPAPAAAPGRPAAASGQRVKASPLARKIAAQSGVDLRVVHGSGPGGRIVRKDVEAAQQAAPAARPAFAEPAVTGPEYEDRPLSQMRATIARRMPQSKAPVPHFYITSEIAMDEAWALREQLNALDGLPKISVNDFVVRACALALLQHPGVNAAFQGEAIRVFHRAHIGIAVSLEEGLITPVLRDCQSKSLARIATEARDLAERARQRKLRAPELSGATFSISNLGMFDVEEFSAIINPPEGAILAVGSVKRVPVAGEDGVTVGRRMRVTLSCDHRVMDGAMGARFLQDVKRLLEAPLRLMV